MEQKPSPTSESNYPRVPLIVLTGFPDTDMATSFLRQGVVDYLVKPGRRGETESSRCASYRTA